MTDLPPPRAVFWETDTEFGIKVWRDRLSWETSFPKHPNPPQSAEFIESMVDRINGIGEPASARIVLTAPTPPRAYLWQRIAFWAFSVSLAHYIGRVL